MPRKTRKSKNVDYYVLFGFNKSYKDETGYFDCKNKITTELSCAKIFPSSNVLNIKGFGTPEKWVEFINSDSHLNNGFKFHLVKIHKHPKISAKKTS